jgi:ribose transport system substrate-binding protein
MTITGAKAKFTSRGTICAAISIAALLILSACSSSTAKQTTGSARNSTDEATSAATVALAADYAGSSNTSPPSSGPKAVRGKTVWIVSCGQTTSCGVIAKGASDAGQALGWKTKTCDGALDANNAYVTCMDQAIAAKADGILTIALDCAAIQPALTAAKAAGIPVVNEVGFDCSDNLPRSAGPNLFTASLIPSSTLPTMQDYYNAQTTAETNWLIADSHGTAKVINFDFTSNSAGVLNARTMKTNLAKCSGCQLIDVPFNGQQFTPQGLSSLFQSAVLKHPEANSVQAFSGSVFLDGLAQAVKTSAKKIVAVAPGSDGPTLDLIRDEGGLDAAVGNSEDGFGWAGADTLNRIFAGTPAVAEGLGYQTIDKSHNMPATGPYVFTGTDYKAAYEKVWNGS